MLENGDRFLTTAEVLELCGISKAWLYVLINRRGVDRVRTYKKNGRRYYSATDVLQLAEKLKLERDPIRA